MGVRQFATSISTIYLSEDTNRSTALVRHLLWQARKLGSKGPISRRLSRSVLTDDEPGGVIALDNALGLYDFNNMNLVRLALSDGGALVDVGANIGSYTLVASENPKANVLSVEPNPTAFRKLERNIADNERGNVVTVNVAASSSPGVLRMTDDGSAPINQIVPGGFVPGGTGKQHIIDVSADTLDAICAAHRITPRVIKIDVEGHEPEVLKGATACLAGALVCIVEGGERSAVSGIMSMNSLRGPYYYHHRLGCMSLKRQRLPEDSVYLGEGFETEFPSIRVAERFIHP